VAVQPDTPALEDVVADLRVLRERGLVRIRHSDLPALDRAAARTEALGAAGGGPGAVEALVRTAVENLGEGSLGAAASATFGLARSARDKPAQDRRRQAAVLYHVSVERFRKHHERVVLEQVAEEILKLCPPSLPHGARQEYLPPELGRAQSLAGTVNGEALPITIHTGPIEMLSDVDILVVPHNVYLEMPQHYKASVAAAVGRAAALRGEDGQIVADVVHDELADWVHRHGRTGLPVAPGTVTPTSSGAMANQNIRRLYHAAIAVPRPGTNDYDVEPPVLAQAVRHVLATARAERADYDPPLHSIGWPLLGAGRGGLLPETSFAWLWIALERELTEHGPWDVHFITRRRTATDLIVAKLAEAGVIARPESEPD
jgi:hypothetical protein